MKILSSECKNIITKSKLPDADYVINPYTGCLHSCIYCYAEFMKRFARIDEDWGNFAVVKNFTLKPSSMSKYKDKTILISSVTDPYQAIEKKYKQMHKILQGLQNCEGKIEVLTKSSLVLRDIELLKAIPNITVGISLNTMDDNFRKIIEPRTSSVNDRLNALKILHSNGIKTYLFIAPIFPGLTDVQQLVEETASYVDYFLLENLNLRGNYKDRVLKMIQSEYPEKLDLYNSIYLEKSSYWTDYENELVLLRNQLKAEMKIYFNH